MPRFVILVHDHPFLHWDLLLENGDVCRTWRLLAVPDSVDNHIAAEALDAHRLLYLDYEGPVSGQRGTVTRWDAGSFEWVVDQPNMCEMLLAGVRWQGRARLTQVDGRNWTFSWISTAPRHGSFPSRLD